MKQQAALTQENIALDRISAVPVYLQLYQRFREALAQGLLLPGQRVPSIRSLASELKLARGTVEAAYDLLCGEGYFVARGQAGTIVAPLLKVQSLNQQAQPLDTASAVSNMPNLPLPAPLPMQPGLPALDAFPRKLWSRLGSRLLKSAQAGEMNYPDALGLMSLRKALAGYLLVARGVQCRPEQIIITSGYRACLQLLSYAYLKPLDQVWMENPAYFAARDLMLAQGQEVIGLAVDEQGLQVELGLQLAPKAKMAIVTPSHHSPLGITLSLPRRQQLLQWASAQQSWIVEDDYDGEFHYLTRPLPALKHLDNDQRVFYTGTFSKTLIPSLRLAYMVVPESQLALISGLCKTFDNSTPWLEQALVAQLLSEGHFTRHLKKMRNLYQQRRLWLSAALQAQFGHHASLTVQAGGLHLVLELQQQQDRELALHLNQQGLAVHALSAWATGPILRQGLIMGYTNIRSAAEAQALAQRLYQACEIYLRD